MAILDIVFTLMILHVDDTWLAIETLYLYDEFTRLETPEYFIQLLFPYVLNENTFNIKNKLYFDNN